MTTWCPSRVAGLAQLQRFLPHAGRDYRKHRNFDNGPEDRGNVSLLSPYIRHRMVHEQEVVSAVLQEHSLVAAEKFIDEVFWRTYWQGWLEHRPQVWHRYLDDVRCLSERLTAHNPLTRRYSAATTGTTGIAPFDTWTRELVQNGYLHNHARMWYASIWIFTLELPWQLGADFFLRHLLDGDPASNTLSWRWVAGLHTRGKTYLATPDNISHYAQRRFSEPQAKTGMDLLADSAPPCREPTTDNIQPISWPPEVLAHGRVGLLVTMEDLSLDVPFQPTAVAGLPSTAMPHLPVADTVMQFRQEALQDAMQRAASTWPDAAVDTIEPGALLTWARNHQLDTIVTAYTPQGFVHQDVSRLRGAAIDAGLNWQVHLHRYDRLAWPHTQKGFHHLRKRIPNLVTELTQLPLQYSA